jgi:hexosaminidase
MSSLLLSTAFASSLGLVPAPQDISFCPELPGQAATQIPQNINLKVAPEFSALQRQLEKTHPEFLKKYDKPTVLKINLNSNIKNPEGYHLNLNSNEVKIEASSIRGAQYALTSLEQILNNSSSMPCVQIKDSPRFSYRGLHLDVSRHFFKVKEIKKVLDAMAFYKLNTFHWHLTDTQGWRIEIKKYPRLTEVGAWRADRLGLPWNERTPQQTHEKATYGGFYTQEQIKEVVDYAAKLNIQVIPEIEIPAHASAAIVAYPWLACNSPIDKVPTGGVWPETQLMCVAKDSVMTFLKDVLKEVVPLFPSPYIHLGGDEADFKLWEKDPIVTAKLKSLNLTSIKYLQGWSHKELSEYVAQFGKKSIGWDEILDHGELAKNSTSMIWRSPEALQKSLDLNVPTIYSYYENLYFDYAVSQGLNEPASMSGYTPLSKVYSLKLPPLPKGKESLVLGIQGQLWSEFMPTISDVEYKLFPRIGALAERAWSPESRTDLIDFKERLYLTEKSLSRLGYNINWQNLQPEITSEVSGIKSVRVSISKALPSLKVKCSLQNLATNKVDTLLDCPSTLSISSPSKIEAWSEDQFEGKPILGKKNTVIVNAHLGIGQKISSSIPSDEKYSVGVWGLNDGLYGSTNFSDKHWAGYEGKDVSYKASFTNPETFSSVQIGFLKDMDSWIFLPLNVKIKFTYIDKTTSEEQKSAPQNLSDLKIWRPQFKPTNNKAVAFYEVFVEAQKTCPEGHSGAGKSCFLFVDEIETLK